MKQLLSCKAFHLGIIIALLVTTIMIVAPAASVNAKQPQQTWNLVWSDEFNGSSVNTSNWTFETGGGGWGNNELQYYTNGSNATVSGGILTIEARRESMGGYAYTSTRIKTQGKRQFTYGRMEARLAVPMGQGLWPAFWMLGANFPTVGWPACGEIDIMEHINTQNTTYGTIHWDYNGYATYGGSTGVNNPAAFHTYAIEWNASSIKWFLDGVQFHEANILNNINGTDEFHRPFFFILNLAVGGNWPGSPNTSTPFPARYQIDYVRVYQLGTGPAPTATPGTGPTQRWESVNFPGYFIRHINSRGRIDTNVSPLADSQFVMVPGLANSSAVSFQSVNFPTRYLRHRNGEIWLDTNDGSALFKADATFYKRPGLANSAYVSFESYNYPGRYIRHRGWLLYNESGSGSLFNSDATFIAR